VDLVLQNIFSKKIRLEDVMELPYRTGRKQKVVSKSRKADDDVAACGGAVVKPAVVLQKMNSGEWTKEEAVEHLEMIVGGTPAGNQWAQEALKILRQINPLTIASKKAQLADVVGGDFKVGDRVLVKFLRRSGEVTDLKRVEQTNEIVYEVALHGVPEPKLFKAEALEKLTESEAEAVEAGAGDVQNFPGTTAAPGQSVVTPPAMPGSEIMASSATSRARSFYRLGKKTIAEDKSTPVGGEPDKISREPQRKPGRGPSQADGVAKYHEAYDPRNLGSGFYKPVKTAERIIEDVTMRRYPDYQTAFDAWTKGWDEHPRKEVIQALKWVKVDVEAKK